MSELSADDPETVLVMNPQSGSGQHSQSVRDCAAILDYTPLETEREDHAIELARQAVADGADEVIAVGGDGTVNEVVRGVGRANGLDEVTVGVIPTGTGNDFAERIGITGIDEGFQTVADGRRRWLDLGLASDRLFVNSCLAGVTAEASERPTSTSTRTRGSFTVSRGAGLCSTGSARGHSSPWRDPGGWMQSPSRTTTTTRDSTSTPAT